MERLGSDEEDILFDTDGTHQPLWYLINNDCAALRDDITCSAYPGMGAIELQSGMRNNRHGSGPTLDVCIELSQQGRGLVTVIQPNVRFRDPQCLEVVRDFAGRTNPFDDQPGCVLVMFCDVEIAGVGFATPTAIGHHDNFLELPGEGDILGKVFSGEIV